MSGSVTAAHEPAQLGGHDGDEVRTESWAVVEAGAACGPEVWCGMWEGREAQAEGGDESWAASWLAEGEEGIRIELGIEG